MSTPASATGGPAVAVGGSVGGPIVIGDHNLVIDRTNGTVIVERTEPVRRRRPAAAPPRPPEPFVGRAAELERLAAAIAARRAVTVTGEAGAGRTALLRAAANGPGAALIDGVLRLDTIDAGVGLSLADLAQCLHDTAWDCVPPVKVNPASARAALGQIDALVLIDDVGLPGADLERLVDLVPAGAVLVATAAPTIDGDLPEVAIGRLERSSAIELLAAHAGLPAAGAPATLDPVCELLADWPAALVVAGRAIARRGLDPAAAAGELRTVAAGSSPAVAIERAYALAGPTIDSDARRLLVAAALLPGRTHDPALLRRVVGDPPWFEAAAATLRAAGLLTLNSPRYAVPDAIRVLVAHEAGGAPTELLDRQVDVAVQAVRERSLDPDFVVDELGWLLGALDRAVRHGRHREAIELGRAIAPHLVIAGLWDAWGRVAGFARDAATSIGSSADVAWATHELGTRDLALGHRQSGTALLREALRIRRGLGDIDGVAVTLANLRALGVRRFGGWFVRAGTVGLAAVLILLLGVLVGPIVAPPPSPSPTEPGASPTPTPTPAPTPSPSPSATPTPTPTPTPAPTPTPTPTPLSIACVTFDDLEVGTTFGEPAGQAPGDVALRTPEGIRVTAQDFFYSSGGGTFNYAEVFEPRPDFGSNPYLWFNNLNLEFDFTDLPFRPLRVEFVFQDFGGNHNLGVNDSPIHRVHLLEAPTPIGGADWVATDPEGDQVYVGTLNGLVDRVLVGGQELAFDTVCAYPERAAAPSPTGPPVDRSAWPARSEPAGPLTASAGGLS